MSRWGNEVPFGILAGKTLAAINKEGDGRLVFVCTDGYVYGMDHQQDCCESVTIDDITGDLADVIGSPLLIAEERSSDENPQGIAIPEYQDSFTWTFYELATNKGSVTIRWYGESNGYYSESVDFYKISGPGEI
jgi:hypothetical protein